MTIYSPRPLSMCGYKAILQKTTLFWTIVGKAFGECHDPRTLAKFVECSLNHVNVFIRITAMLIPFFPQKNKN